MTSILTAIVIGFGTITELEIREHFDGYYIEFVTGTPTATPVEILICKNGHHVARFRANILGSGVFISGERIKMEIGK